MTQRFIVTTHTKDQVIDITDEVEEFIHNSDVTSGICVVFTAHTTCCITTADLDPGTDLDLLDAIRNILPDMQYRHPHNPSHAPDHMLSSLIGPSVTIPFENRELLLGMWQRIVLIELDGPRDRTLYASLLS